MRTLLDNLFEGLAKARQVYLETEKIQPRFFHALVRLDPTQQKKYIEWMCRVFLSDQINPSEIRMFEIVATFDELVNKHTISGADSDINRYKTLESLVDIVNQKKDTKTKGEVEKEIKNEGATLAYENEFCRIYKILTREASCVYGSGTKWCTAASHSSNYFNRYFYERGVNLYYIIPKGDHLTELGKFAVAVEQNGRKTVYNQRDSVVGRPNIVFQTLQIPWQ